MADFLSIREATQIAGVSVTTLRRLVRGIVADNAHADREHILPSVDDVRRMKTAGQQFTWTISRELLLRDFGERSPKLKVNFASEFGPLGEIVVVLRDQLQATGDQLKVKDSQIASQVEIIQSLNERLREGNILIGSLQRQLALPEAAVMTSPVASKDAPPGKATKVAEKHATPKRQARKGLLARLFR
ncbi:MAG: hypothetical protein Q8K78_08360 [Planctomycetaceae bacterium]|nr:hypothetical protein [Planctomycetaceae bacterium]